MKRKKVVAIGEVFLSHASRDRRLANQVAKTLRRHRVRVWYSQTHILGAQQWHDEIGRALQRCNWFLILLTPAAVKSMWVKRELLFALETSRYQGKIVPLLCKKCNYSELSWTLSAFQHVDYTGDFDTGCRSLFRIWKLVYTHR